MRVYRVCNFFAIVSSYLAILREVRKSELRDIKSVFIWLFNFKYFTFILNFISRNSVFIFHSCEFKFCNSDFIIYYNIIYIFNCKFISHNFETKVRIARYKLAIERKRSELRVYISQFWLYFSQLRVFAILQFWFYDLQLQIYIMKFWEKKSELWDANSHCDIKSVFCQWRKQTSIQIQLYELHTK